MIFARLAKWLGTLLTFFGAGYLMSWMNGRKNRKLKEAEDFRKTTKELKDADAEFDEVVGDDPDAARRWLRERKP